VIALDEAAAVVVRRLASRHHTLTHLLTVALGEAGTDGNLTLRGPDGMQSQLNSELCGADLVVMVATADANPVAAAAIADSCSSRGIMTAGVILDGRQPGGPALNALRPHARVLMSSHDGSDVAEVLTALRA
jgi:hypothetical protein